MTFENWCVFFGNWNIVLSEQTEKDKGEMQSE
jgi:hypothetical protein